MSNIPGLEIYDLNILNELDLDVFNKEKDINKIQTVDEVYRKVKVVFIEKYGLEVIEEIKKEISRCLEDYKNKYMIEINSREDFLLIQYSEGGLFDAHIDDYGFGERVLSMGLYLNDDYTGGELEFTFFDKILGKIKPKKNQLFLFPSNYVYNHKSHVIENGKKYMILCFFSKYKERTEKPYTNNYNDVFKI